MVCSDWYASEWQTHVARHQGYKLGPIASRRIAGDWGMIVWCPGILLKVFRSKSIIAEVLVMMMSSVAMADTLLHWFPSRPSFVQQHHPRLEYAFAQGCENHKSESLQNSQKQQEFNCRKEGVGKQNPPQSQRDFSHIDEALLQQPSRKSWRIMQKLKRSGGRELVVPVFVKRSDGKWSDSWQSQQVTTLQQLKLEDMALDTHSKATQQAPTDVVLVDLDVQKVGSSFQAWLTPTRDPFSHPQHIGEDNDDPTVIYFPPSEEIADISGMVRDTIRLSQSSKAICSKECENLGPRKWEFGESDHQSVDKQWLPLLNVKRNF